MFGERYGWILVKCWQKSGQNMYWVVLMVCENGEANQHNLQSTLVFILLLLVDDTIK